MEEVTHESARWQEIQMVSAVSALLVYKCVSFLSPQSVEPVCRLNYKEGRQVEDWAGFHYQLALLRKRNATNS